MVLDCMDNTVLMFAPLTESRVYDSFLISPPILHSGFSEAGSVSYSILFPGNSVVSGTPLKHVPCLLSELIT